MNPSVMSECTALLSQKSDYGGVLDSASACALCQPTIAGPVFL